MSSAKIELAINGEPAAVEAAAIPDLLRALGYDPEQQGIAVAVNAEVVPRSQWAESRVADGDRVEIVGAKQGG